MPPISGRQVAAATVAELVAGAASPAGAGTAFVRLTLGAFAIRALQPPRWQAAAMQLSAASRSTAPTGSTA